MTNASFEHFLAENTPISLAPEPRKNLKLKEDFHENRFNQEAKNNRAIFQRK